LYYFILFYHLFGLILNVEIKFSSSINAIVKDTEEVFSFWLVAGCGLPVFLPAAEAICSAYMG